LFEVAAEQMRKLSFGHVFAGKSHEPQSRLPKILCHWKWCNFFNFSASAIAGS